MSVIYEVVRGVAWATIDRAEASNALNESVRSGLFDAAERFNADDTALVLVLTGAGDRAFCAGGDLKEMAETTLQVPPPDFVPQFGRNIEVTKPTISAVNGVAYAGGFLLAMMCDLCVAAEHARFAITEAKVGRGVPWGVRLPWLLPPRVAMQLLLTGDPIDARRAYELGLVNEVVPTAELRGTAQRLGETIAANAPLSVAAAKQMIRRDVWDARGTDAFDWAEHLWESVYRSKDAQEGPRAFRERRPPRWQGK
ncbi:MAG: enoyl-CoA hydratase-related protein [Acidimicrobiia bacterium]